LTVTVIELLSVPVVMIDTPVITDGSYEILVSKEIILRPVVSVVLIGTVTTVFCTADNAGIETTGHGGADDANDPDVKLSRSWANTANIFEVVDRNSKRATRMADRRRKISYLAAGTGMSKCVDPGEELLG